ncbi:Alkaline phosphatase [Sinorhizobium fredii CCBAU 25509]|nr:Alkaline phosphatase [Sinorhizobium fredii CCBAU 25509]
MKFIPGTDGADTLNGDFGTDQILGMGGNDTLSGSFQGDMIFGDTGEDTVNGNSGDDFLDGGDASDDINGGSGRDTIMSEVPLSGTGDVVDGGSGTDRLMVNYSELSEGVSITIRDWITPQTLTGNIQATNVEAFYITGTDFADTVTGGNYSDMLSGARATTS